MDIARSHQLRQRHHEPTGRKRINHLLGTRKAQLEQLSHWQINGKIAVITKQDSGSASVNWQERQGSYTISMYGPLGANGIVMTASRAM